MSKDHWNQSFSSDEFIYGKVANEFIQQKSEMIPAHSSIACLAEGEGRNAVFLARQGFDVTAYDQSVVGLKKMGRFAEENDVEIKTTKIDLTKERIKEKEYDAAIMVFGHVPKEDQPFILENLLGCVKPGGYAIFEVYSEAQIDYKTGGPGTVKALYDPATVLDIVDQHKVIHFYYGEAERHEGKRHTGLCHVVQVVVQKE